MTQPTFSPIELDAASSRVRHGVARRLRTNRRIHRSALIAGALALSAAGVAAASTALPPQTKGEIYTPAAYLAPLAECLTDEGWNAWVAVNEAGPSEGSIHFSTPNFESVHFSVSGYEARAFADDVDSCRSEVAASAGVPLEAVLAH